MLITVCVVAYNEEKVLPGLLDCIKAQDYPHDQMEILLVNSMSADGTKKVMEDFAKDNSDFYGIQVLDNPCTEW